MDKPGTQRGEPCLMDSGKRNLLWMICATPAPTAKHQKNTLLTAVRCITAIFALPKRKWRKMVKNGKSHNEMAGRLIAKIGKKADSPPRESPPRRLRIPKMDNAGEFQKQLDIAQELDKQLKFTSKLTKDCQSGQRMPNSRQHGPRLPPPP